MPVNNIITFRKGTEFEWSNINPILANGEPGWDTTNNLLKIGDGTSTWNELDPIVSKNIRGTFLLNESQESFTIDSGYTVGSLDIFLNGVKLSSSGDYIANDGMSFILAESAPSGSIIEYLALAPTISNVGTLNFISSASVPSNPSIGDMWFNTSTGNLFIYITDGTNSHWVEPFGPPGDGVYYEPSYSRGWFLS